MSPALLKSISCLLCAGLWFFALSCNANNSDTNQAVKAATFSSADISSATPVATASTTATLPGAVPPVTATPAINATPIGSGRHLLNVALALMGIIALILVISWFGKRFGQGGFAQNQHMKIIASMPLGTRERILVVDVGGQQLLLGITATTINTLHVFNEPIQLPGKEDNSSDFSRKLMAILQQKPSDSAGVQNNNHNGPV